MDSVMRNALRLNNVSYAYEKALPQVSYGKAGRLLVAGVAVVTTPTTPVVGIPVVNDLISICRIRDSDASATETEFLTCKGPRAFLARTSLGPLTT